MIAKASTANFLALMCACSIGCAQSKSTLPQQIGAVDSPDRSVQAAKPASDVVPAAHVDSDEAGAPRVRVRVQQVEFMQSPAVDAALEAIWADQEPSAGRCRVVPSKHIQSEISVFTSQGQAKVWGEKSTVVSSGSTRTWDGFARWTMTPTVRSPNLIHLDLAGEVTKTTPDDATQTLWQASAAVELHPGETVVVEGMDYHGMSTEISRIPILGDIPFVGPMVFSAKKSRTEHHKVIYLVTAELATEGEIPQQGSDQ